MRGLLNARHKKCILERRYLPAESVQEGVRCCACVRACVRACVHVLYVCACVCACVVCVHVCVLHWINVW